MSILDRFALTGGVAVVTGAGRGIGEGIAIGLAEAGCDVVLTARRENEINAVAEKVRALGRRALAIPGDITDGDFVEQLADRAKEEMGKVTLWVSNAGGADDRTPRHLADSGPQGEIGGADAAAHGQKEETSLQSPGGGSLLPRIDE